MRRNPDIIIKPDLFLCLSLMLLTVPLKFVWSWLLAALVHELGHIILLLILKVPILRIQIGAMGAKIETEPIHPGKQLLCVAAGPVFGSLLVMFGKEFPALALCAWVQTIFNLLPIRGLDGGRILSCLSMLVLPPKAGEKLCFIIEILCVVSIALLAFYLWWRLRAGIIWLTVPLFMILRFVKIPCKPGKQIVQ